MRRYIRLSDILAPRMIGAIATLLTAVAAFVVTFAVAASIDAWLDAHPALTLLFAAGLIAIGVAGLPAALWVHDALTRRAIARAKTEDRDAWLSRQWISGGVPE